MQHMVNVFIEYQLPKLDDHKGTCFIQMTFEFTQHFLKLDELWICIFNGVGINVKTWPSQRLGLYVGRQISDTLCKIIYLHVLAGPLISQFETFVEFIRFNPYS